MTVKGERHLGPGLGESKGNRLTDAGIAARDKGAFMVESNVHGFSVSEVGVSGPLRFTNGAISCAAFAG